jgi:predicted Rossmann fold flavoprotein
MNVPKANPIVIVGGGGAGILAAWRASVLGAPVLLLERNRKIGIKILISGGGKCNLTHAGPMEEIRSAFVKREARFLKPAFYRFTNADIVRLVEDGGVPTYSRQNGRVFPTSGMAKDIVSVFERLLKDQGVIIRTTALVESISAEQGTVIGVHMGGNLIPASLVVLATGGASYPKTGTTGDGFRWAETLGHTIVPIHPALAPLILSPPLPGEWSGISLRSGRLIAKSEGKEIASQDGDVLITHEGISGPATLEISRPVSVAMGRFPVTVEYDFFPGKEFSLLDDELTRIVRQHQGMIERILESWLPNRLVGTLLKSAGVEPATRGYSLTREGRRSIVSMLKGWTMGTVSQVPLERGEVTAGGISLDEVNPRTMESRKVHGLFVCGEVLDIAGPVGGYNLQAAFSTGFVAGEVAARAWHDSISSAPDPAVQHAR